MRIVVRLDIPVAVESGNVILRAGAHGFDRKGIQTGRLRKRFEKWIPPASYMQRHNDRKRFLRLTRLIPYRGRAFDEDNLALGFKGAVDLFVRLRWLKDDSPKWLERDYVQTKIPAKLVEECRKMRDPHAPTLEILQSGDGTIFELYDFEEGES